VQQRRLGTSGLVVSRLGLGTMGWGRDTDPDAAADQLAAFRDAGGTLIDTADSYTDGAAETILGRLISGPTRSEVIVATAAGAAGPLGAGCSRRHLVASLDASLARLGTDHVDLWQLHRWDARVPLEESLSALDAAVGSGRARYVGVAGFTGWQSAAAATWQRAWPGREPLASCQLEWSLLARDVEAECVPAARYAGLGLLARSPLARGVLTGKYRHGVPADSRAAAPGQESFLADHLGDEATRVVDAVVTAADGLGASPLAVALAWVRDQPGVGAAVVGARTQGQLLGILGSESLTLPAEIRQALDDVSAP
jgi:aryl-alcohol dehydrogenase-like predicted oxidoreductase